MVVYQSAMKKHELGEYQDLSDLQYTMTPETSRKWVDEKAKYQEKLNTKLEELFDKEKVRKAVKKLLYEEYELKFKDQRYFLQ